MTDEWLKGFFEEEVKKSEEKVAVNEVRQFAFELSFIKIKQSAGGDTTIKIVKPSMKSIKCANFELSPKELNIPELFKWKLFEQIPHTTKPRIPDKPPKINNKKFGFKNSVNNCYLSTALHILIEAGTEVFLNIDHLMCNAQEMGIIPSFIRTALINSYEHTSITEVKRILSLYFYNYRNNGFHNVQNCVIDMLTIMELEVGSILYRKKRCDEWQMVNRQEQYESLPLFNPQHLFSITFIKRQLCTKCKHWVLGHEKPQSFLKIPLETTVNDALSKYFNSITKIKGYTCTNCNNDQKCIQSTKIEKHSKFILIELLREKQIKLKIPVSG